MAPVLDLNKCYSGKVCGKHPVMAGLRQKSNRTCIQCARDKCAARLAKHREAQGKPKRVLYSPEDAKERIRVRDLERNRLRRLDQAYAASQVARKQKWRAENKDRYLAVSRAYDAKQRAENLQRRLSKNLRHRLRKAMLGETRGVSAVRDLGCSMPEFRAHIERQFMPGMTWENYGAGWHLDHIHPLALFDLSDKAQAAKACHYSNLQPLWASENQRKWCKPHRHTWPALYAQALAAATEGASA